MFGPNYDQTYDRTAFEADLPAVESNTCNRSTGEGCTLIPIACAPSAAAR